MDATVLLDTASYVGILVNRICAISGGGVCNHTSSALSATEGGEK